MNKENMHPDDSQNPYHIYYDNYLGSLTAWVHRMPLKALLGFIFFVNF